MTSKIAEQVKQLEIEIKQKTQLNHELIAKNDIADAL